MSPGARLCRHVPICAAQPWPAPKGKLWSPEPPTQTLTVALAFTSSCTWQLFRSLPAVGERLQVLLCQPRSWAPGVGKTCGKRQVTPGDFCLEIPGKRAEDSLGAVFWVGSSRLPTRKSYVLNSESYALNSLRRPDGPLVPCRALPASACVASHRAHSRGPGVHMSRLHRRTLAGLLT